MRRKLAGILAAGLMLGCCGGNSYPVSAAGADLDEYIQARDGSYRPMEQGYYGYFPVCYGNEGAVTAGIPALVRDGHTYLDAEDLCQRLGMDYEVDDAEGTFCVSAWQRTVTFQKDSSQCGIKIGPFLMEASMPLAPVYQDDTLWVGAEWFFWMTGGTFFPVPDGYVAIGAPAETALDVIAELYSDGGTFNYGDAFGLSAEGLEELDLALDRLDQFDGILNFEWDKWVAAANQYPQDAFGAEGEMYDIITDSGYGADFMDLLLEITADEAYSIAEAQKDINSWAVESYLEVLEKLFKSQSQFLSNQATAAAYLENLAADTGNYNFSQILGWYSNKAICQSIDAAAKSDVFDALGKGAKSFSVLMDIVDCWNAYANRDVYAMEGAEAVVDILEQQHRLGVTEMSYGMIQAMNSMLKTYHKSQSGFTFTKWFVENIGGYAGDVLVDMIQIVGAPIKIYQLGSRLYPSSAAILKEAEAFEKSLIGVLYQPAAYTAYQLAADACFSRRTPNFSFRDAAVPFEVDFDEEELDQAVAQAYHYVKARYVTRELALTALEVHEDKWVYQNQAALQSRELERLRVLSEYCAEDLPVPSQWSRKAEDYDDSYLRGLVTPAYVRVTGSFVDGQTGEGVSDVSVQVRDQTEAVMAEFVSGEDGAFDFYLPLLWREELSRQLQKPQEQTEGDFAPWEEAYWRNTAYPPLQEDTSLVWSCSHPDYPEFTRTFSQLTMAEPEEAGPFRELRLDTGQISLGVDYYQYIRDELLPEMGFASLETDQRIVSTENFSEMVNWDQRRGLLGADIADLNQDGIEDLLVYDIAEDEQSGANPDVLRVSLYSVTEKGKIERISTTNLLSIGDAGYTRVKIGLMGLDDSVFLYVEKDSYAYFANGGSVTYTWYCWDENGVFRPRWMVGHTDGGSIGLACSVLDYYEENGCDKYVLCADGDFRYTYPDVEIMTDVAEHYEYETEPALRAGFAMLGLNKVGVYQDSPNLYFTQSGRLPTCWGTELMKESVSYLCKGEQVSEGQSGTRYVREFAMTVSLEDRTGLRERIRKLDAAG